MPAADDQSTGSSESIADSGVASTWSRGVAGGFGGRVSSTIILIGESVTMGCMVRFRSLHAAMIDNGDAQRLVRLAEEDVDDDEVKMLWMVLLEVLAQPRALR